MQIRIYHLEVRRGHNVSCANFTLAGYLQPKLARPVDF